MDITTRHGTLEQKPNERKMQELIVYISQESADDSSFGYTKLNKLLFLIDFSAYVYLGRSVTGHEYQKKQRGPCPVGIEKIRKKMVNENHIKVEKIFFSGGRQYKPKAERKPCMNYFEAGEMNLINGIIRRWRQSTATEMSERSHEFSGWSLAKINETIPYGASLIDDRAPLQHEIDYAHKLGEEIASGSFPEIKEEIRPLAEV